MNGPWGPLGERTANSPRSVDGFHDGGRGHAVAGTACFAEDGEEVAGPGAACHGGGCLAFDGNFAPVKPVVAAGDVDGLVGFLIAGCVSEAVVSDFAVGHDHETAASVGWRDADDARSVDASEGFEGLLVGLGEGE